jgi:hypothetical protein
MRINSSGAVGIGTTANLQGSLTVFNGDNFSTATNNSSDNIYLISDATSGDGVYGASISFSRVQYPDRKGAAIVSVQNGSDEDNVGLAFFTHPSATATDPLVEAMRITSAGDLLIGKTTTALGTAGHRISSAVGTFVRDGGGALIVHRLSNDGNLLEFYKDSTLVGSIKSNGGVTLDIDGGGDRVGLALTGDSYLPRKNGSLSDDTNSIGDGSRRLDNIFATNSSINTSDKNEKQDIEELTDAEKRVAVVAKGLMRKYRWKSRVAQKGDKARTHFGIIAQDLQDAFTAESLDASDYAMFCSDTWWEKEISVDAVEAKDAVYKEVTDEDGVKTNELVSAEVEAKDAYTYTDTKQEATTGYTEKTRLGVRYP